MFSRSFSTFVIGGITNVPITPSTIRKMASTTKKVPLGIRKLLVSPSPAAWLAARTAVLMCANPPHRCALRRRLRLCAPLLLGTLRVPHRRRLELCAPLLLGTLRVPHRRRLELCAPLLLGTRRVPHRRRRGSRHPAQLFT